MTRTLSRTPLTWLIGAVLAVGVVFGLYWFQPWKLVTNKQISDRPPSIAATPFGPSPAATGGSAPAATPVAPGSAVPDNSAPANRLLAAGMFVSHEHATTGTAQLVQLADGRRQLVLLDLATTSGPDLRVWLTDQTVAPSAWRVFDDGRHLELSRLKGNRGNQVYDVPAGVDLSPYRSVTIWCKRFSVSFGAAELTRITTPSSAAPS